MSVQRPLKPPVTVAVTTMGVSEPSASVPPTPRRVSGMASVLSSSPASLLPASPLLSLPPEGTPWSGWYVQSRTKRSSRGYSPRWRVLLRAVLRARRSMLGGWSGVAARVMRPVRSRVRMFSSRSVRGAKRVLTEIWPTRFSPAPRWRLVEAALVTTKLGLATKAMSSKRELARMGNWLGVIWMVCGRGEKLSLMPQPAGKVMSSSVMMVLPSLVWAVKTAVNSPANCKLGSDTVPVTRAKSDA